MILPGADRAVVDVEKLRNYCLNPAHPRGRHKARVFASALLLLQTDADWLKAQLLEAALTMNAVEVKDDEYGTRFTLDFNCTKETLKACVRSGWIVRLGENFPRLTTCFVISEEVCHG